MSSPAQALEPTRVQVERALAGKRVEVRGLVFQGALLVCLLLLLAFILVLIAQVVQQGGGVLVDRGVGFLTSDLSRTNPEQAGVRQGIIGSVFIAGFVAVVAFPLGIATAVYIEEYAPDNRFTRFIDLNIRNLAGVPSVVYGLLGLAIFVQLLGTDMGGGGLTGGRTILSGGLTMAVLVLPIVIITAAEAIRAVPQSLREGGYGVGATRWEVTRTLVLPNATPGILTGTVLAMSRAIGETAPLILVGAVFGTFFATGDQSLVQQVTEGRYTALPMTVLSWAKQADPVFRDELASAAIIVLLAVTLLANALAIFLRNRYDKRW